MNLDQANNGSDVNTALAAYVPSVESRPVNTQTCLGFDRAINSSPENILALMQSAGMDIPKDLQRGIYKVGVTPASLKGLLTIMGAAKLKAPLLTVRGATVDGVTSATAYFDPASAFSYMLNPKLAAFKANQIPFITSFDGAGKNPAGAESVSFASKDVVVAAGHGAGVFGWMISHRTLDTLSGVSPISLSVVDATGNPTYTYTLRPERIGTECRYFLYNTSVGQTTSANNAAAAAAEFSPNFASNQVVTTTIAAAAESSFLQFNFNSVDAKAGIVLTGLNAEVTVYPVLPNPVTRAAFLACLREGRMEIFSEWILQNYQSNTSIQFV